MNTIQTEIFTLPSWKGDLMISLFNGDGGDGFLDEEIREANDFIQENKLMSLVDITEPAGDEVVCTFIIAPAQMPTIEWVWAMSGEYTKLYDEFGLFPFEECDDPGYEARMIPLTSAAHKEKFLSKYLAENTWCDTFIRGVENKLIIWWKSAPEKVKRAFSVLPSYDDSWDSYSLDTRMDIYNYSIMTENDIDIPEDEGGRLLVAIVTRLTQKALEYLFNMPVTEMAGLSGCYMPKYRPEFDRLYNNIEQTILRIDFNSIK